MNECRRIGRTIEYGLAQKFVNLALKYCYCFKDAHIPEARNKFEFAHIALDSYTFCPSTTSRNCAAYRRYCRISPSGLPLPFYTETVASGMDIRILPAWSKLKKEGYMSTQNDMRAYFSAHPITYSAVAHLDVTGLAGCTGATVLTPFQCEFLLW